MTIDPSDVHYRIVETLADRTKVTAVCVQDFDYYDYGDRFVTDRLFATERQAQLFADRINNRPWKIKMLHLDNAQVLEDAANAIAEENPLMDEATDVSGWLRERAKKMQWGLI
ncbi:Hypothetical Protein OBI_RACECAR_246 [Arthrobacter phage Racecar]|nr:hypothetical protein PBI_RACECAR_38 [Arthrobacter phage Racecar]QFG12722.1 hypothetical protein PBI_MIMI_38 [Arthrobacter phage Mimi]